MNQIPSVGRGRAWRRRLRLLLLFPVAWTPLLLADSAEPVPITDLGDLDLVYAVAQRVDERPGPARLLAIDTLPGDRLQLRLPFMPNRLLRLVADGEAVDAEQAVARISGPELALWLVEAESIEKRFAAAQARYDSSLALYEAQALSAESWQAIVEHYRHLQLAWEHAEHLRERLRVEGRHSALLLSPVSGIVLFTEGASESGDHEHVVAELIDPASLRLTVQLAASEESPVLALAIPGCRLAIEHVEQRIVTFSRRLWSESGRNCLDARPGMRLEGEVRYAFDGYVVPRSALLRQRGQPAIARRSGDRLQLVPVEIVGEDSDHYYLRSAVALAGSEVLIRSVSALQGRLLGLGSD